MMRRAVSYRDQGVGYGGGSERGRKLCRFRGRAVR